jgi:hypothetical protein
MDLGAETNLCVDLHYASRGEEQSLDPGTSRPAPDGGGARTDSEHGSFFVCIVVLVIGIMVTMWVRVPCAIDVRMFSARRHD